MIVPKPLDRVVRNREYDARRRQAKPWRALYGTKEWKALRLAQLTKEPLCKRCKGRGVVRAATVAHHLKAHKGDRELFFDPMNLGSSCTDCHDVDEQRLERGGRPRQQLADDGWPIG